jgi:ketosteroid isomerase-like protein
LRDVARPTMWPVTVNDEEATMADNVALVRGMYEAFAKGDVQKVFGSLHDKVEWSEAEHFPYWPGHAFVGHKAVLDGVFARIGRDFDGFQVVVSRLVGLGDTVLAEVRYRGAAKATGKKFDVQAAHVWDIRDGKAARFQQYVDTWQIAQVTGFTPRS